MAAFEEYMQDVQKLDVRTQRLLEAWKDCPPAVQDLLYACMRTFKAKGTDYTEGRADRLYNFRKAADDLEVPLPKVWYVYAWKHWTAIVRYVRHSVVSSEPVWKRAMDVIVYLCLLVLWIQEKNEEIPPSIESYDATRHS